MHYIEIKRLIQKIKEQKISIMRLKLDFIYHPKFHYLPVKRDYGFHSNKPNFYPYDLSCLVQLYAKVSSYKNHAFNSYFFHTLLKKVLPYCAWYFLGQDSIKFSNDTMSIMPYSVFIFVSVK